MRPARLNLTRWLPAPTGKTTFVNTLCESEIIGHKISDKPDTAHIEEGIRIKPVNVGEYAVATCARPGKSCSAGMLCVCVRWGAASADARFTA